MEYQVIVDELSRVPGVVALALGGSQSSGTASEGSDHDIGVYYDPERLDVSALGAAVTRLDDASREGVLNPPGAWGPWINGGAWLTIHGEMVDILLKDAPRVAQVLKDCVRGVVSIDYQCGHPFGFLNTIYAAETHYAKPLWQDATAPLDALKRMLGGYPPKMKAALIQRLLWEAGFSIECTRKAARKGDINYLMGGVFRAATAWALVVHALNEVHWMNEKGAMKRLDDLAIAPRDLRERIERVYAAAAQGFSEGALAEMDALQAEMSRLSAKFDVPDSGIRSHND